MPKLPRSKPLDAATQLAKRLHGTFNSYISGVRGLPSNYRIIPWEELEEVRKEAYRHVAADILRSYRRRED